MNTVRPSPQHEIASEASAIMRASMTASLATIDAESGDPYASFITVACSADGSPIFLISDLARHTQNIGKNPRSSLLFVESPNPLGSIDTDGSTADPLTLGRVSVFGETAAIDDASAARRFLARHPGAEGYVAFTDFSFFRMRIDGAHFVGGFGNIHDLGICDLVIEIGDAQPLLEAEDEIVAHMNQDHSNALELYATRLLGGPPGRWRMSACDPSGCDLVLGQNALRLAFPERVTTPSEICRILLTLVEQARAENAG